VTHIAPPSTAPAKEFWLPFIALVVAPLGGCAGPSWRDAAVEAWQSPATWVPAAAAATFWITGADTGVSDWVKQHTPVFGSEESAREWSDDLRFWANRLMNVSQVAYFIDAEETSKPLGQALLGYAAAITATEAGLLIKQASHRPRPSGAAYSPSFPSQHAARSFAYTATMKQTFIAANRDDALSKSIMALSWATSYGTAWARVEAGAHYPSDVLAGAALGNFTALFLQKVMLPHDSPLYFSYDPLSSTMMGGVAYEF
jgi:membrane-associated phospholipid phosphatase